MSVYSPQIIKTLADQVQTLTPLRESFLKLQNYYHQLTRDVAQLVSHTDHSEKQLFANLKYLQEIHHSLEGQFGCCGQQLKQLEYEKARMEMQGNQQNVQAEALKKRELLELQHKSALEGKRKDIAEQNEKVTFAVSTFKEMIHNIELAIKSKQYENVDIQRQIKKMELVNQKITQLNQSAEDSIDKTQQSNEAAVEQIYQLECKLETYDKLIDAKERQNKENVQILITKTQELEQLRNRRQYMQKLLEAELGEQREMTRLYGQMQSLLAVKNDKLMFVRQENEQYEKTILEEKNRQNASKEELLRLKQYLNTLVSTNQHLYCQLEKSCSQDREVQVLLSDKLEKLLVMNDKITQNETTKTRSVPPSLAFQSRNMSPQTASPKGSSANNSFNSTLINQLSSSPKAKDRIIERSYINKAMNSTWGSNFKQNRLV